MSKLVREWYKYVSDDGNTYKMLLSGLFASGLGRQLVAVGESFPTYPRSGRWRPRFIEIEFSSTATAAGSTYPVNKRKKIVMTDPTYNLWVGSVDTTIQEVNGIGPGVAGVTYSNPNGAPYATYVVTGRIGECRPNQSNRDSVTP